MEISFKTDSNNKVSNSKVSINKVSTTNNVDEAEALLMMEMVKVPSALNKG